MHPKISEIQQNPAGNFLSGKKGPGSVRENRPAESSGKAATYSALAPVHPYPISAPDEKVSISQTGKPQTRAGVRNRRLDDRDERLFEAIAVRNRTVSFKKVDNNKIVMQIIDKKTKEIIKEYPPEEVQRISHALEKFLETEGKIRGSKKMDALA